MATDETNHSGKSPLAADGAFGISEMSRLFWKSMRALSDAVTPAAVAASTEVVLCQDHSKSTREMLPCCLMSDAELRSAMHNFIDHEFDLSPLADADLASEVVGTKMAATELIKKIHKIAESMDFHTEMHGYRHGLRSYSGYLFPESAGNKGKLHVDKHIPTSCRYCSALIKHLQHHLIREAWRIISVGNRVHIGFIIRVLKAGGTHESATKSFANIIAFGERMMLTREQKRAEFLERAALDPPAVLRVIDIEATCLGEQVVLMDYWADARVQQVGYSAVSHTYGMEVYEVFDCQCATKCSANLSHPRYWDRPCPHEDDKAAVGSDTEKRNRVVNDILRMCANLMAAGVQYAWHDGVCIGQFDEAEVVAAVKGMGWIYSNANETIVFLHYVGKPMAPIRNGDADDELTCRWHTRVWTLQEAALSKCRRYCVRMGSSPLGDFQSLEEFEEKLALWYRDDTSKIEVIDEPRFCEMLKEIAMVLEPLFQQQVRELSKMLQPFTIDLTDTGRDEPNWLLLKACIRTKNKAHKWRECVLLLFASLISTCFEFPTAQMAVHLGSQRESKHVGDRINSILALSGVKNFVAPKDAKYMEASTMEFFMRQGQKGLEFAVFTTHISALGRDCIYVNEGFQHTWLPFLGVPLCSVIMDGDSSCLEFRVLEDGMLELEGLMVCVTVELTVNLHEDVDQGHNLANDTHTQSWAAVYEMLEARHDHLAINLTRFQSVMRATFPQAPAFPLGDAIVPSLLVLDMTLSACSSPAHRVHLVLPLNPITRDSDECLWPTLVVQGNLHSTVRKVGCFQPHSNFIACLEQMRDQPSITLVRKLIIN